MNKTYHLRMIHEIFNQKHLQENAIAIMIRSILYCENVYAHFIFCFNGTSPGKSYTLNSYLKP